MYKNNNHIVTNTCCYEYTDTDTVLQRSAPGNLGNESCICFKNSSCKTVESGALVSDICQKIK